MLYSPTWRHAASIISSCRFHALELDDPAACRRTLAPARAQLRHIRAAGKTCCWPRRSGSSCRIFLRTGVMTSLNLTGSSDVGKWPPLKMMHSAFFTFSAVRSVISGVQAKS